MPWLRTMKREKGLIWAILQGWINDVMLTKYGQSAIFMMGFTLNGSAREMKTFAIRLHCAECKRGQTTAKEIHCVAHTSPQTSSQIDARSARVHWMTLRPHRCTGQSGSRVSSGKPRTRSISSENPKVTIAYWYQADTRFNLKIWNKRTYCISRTRK